MNGGGLGPASRSATATPFANRAPEFATATTTRSEAENTAAGENIGGPVAAADLDSGDTLVYSLSGVDAASFAINSATGQITVGSATTLDLETTSSYSVTVSVRDGQDAEGNADATVTVDDTVEVTINVIDVNEPPSLSGSSAESYAENGAAAVASYTAADPEGVTITWTLSGDDSEDFTISAAGALSFNTSPNYETPADADTNNAYLVTVEASDGTTGKVTLAVTVTVTNVEEATILSGPSAFYAKDGTSAVASTPPPTRRERRSSGPCRGLIWTTSRSSAANWNSIARLTTLIQRTPATIISIR